jgi:hypothetical protein
MFVNQVYDNIKSEPKYPKSMIKLIKFYRFFGFSFLGISSDGNEKKWSKIKRYLLMAYNLVVIFGIISFQIYVTPVIFEEQKKLGMKKVMKGVFLVSRWITCFDAIFGYLLSLIKAKKFLKFLSNEEFCAIDCNTRNANKIIISLIIGLAIIATFLTTSLVILVNISFDSVPKSYRIVSITLRSLIMAFYYLNGLFLIPVLYYCITSLFVSQINNLNSGLSKGISYKFLLFDKQLQKFLIIFNSFKQLLIIF